MLAVFSLLVNRILRTDLIYKSMIDAEDNEQSYRRRGVKTGSGIDA
jgi:hypothetical protein